MTGHTVLVKYDRNAGWFVRCTEFGCGWPRRDGLARASAQKLADSHHEATA